MNEPSDAPAPGRTPAMKPSTVDRAMVGAVCLSIDIGRRQPSELDVRSIAGGLRRAAMLEKDEDFRQREQADDRHQEIDPVIEMHLAEGEPWHAGLPVHADHGDAETDTGSQRPPWPGCGWQYRPAWRRRAQTAQKYSAGPKQQRHLDQLRRQKHQPPRWQRTRRRRMQCPTAPAPRRPSLSWPWDSRQASSSGPARHPGY